MKPLSELMKEWREEATQSDKLQNCHRDDAAGLSYAKESCADELEAWLREADGEVPRAREFVEHKGNFYVAIDWVRHDLLGTTRQEEGK